VRRASLLSDERYPASQTKAALRALMKIDAKEGRTRQKRIAAPHCPRINSEDCD
jgi:hypothetical protein